MIFSKFIFHMGFFIKTYVVGAEGILIGTHNIGLYEDLTKIFFQLSSNMHPISSSINLLTHCISIQPFAYLTCPICLSSGISVM